METVEPISGGKKSFYIDPMIKWANNEMKKEVMELAGFLKIVKDPEGKLLLGLLHIIYEKFPPTDSKRYGLSQSSVFVRCPCDQALHEVSPFGFDEEIGHF